MSLFTEHREDAAAPQLPRTGTPESRTRQGGDGTHRFLIGLVVVLAAAVVGLGAWMIAEQTSSSDAAVSDEIQQLLDDYHTAWNNWDGDAYLALMTDDAVHVTSQFETSAQEQASLVDSLEMYDWQVEAIGEPIMSGDGPWYVAQANHLTSNTYPADGYDGLSILTVVDDDGEMLISRHVYVGRG